MQPIDYIGLTVTYCGPRIQPDRPGPRDCTVRDVTAYGQMWMSNGAILPFDEFCAKWKVVENVTANE